MATINGYTAEKMKEIADSAFKSAEIVGDNLVITHQDDTVTVVGNVRGPSGTPGISDMALYDPIGVPKPLLIPTIPGGYGVCDGTTEYDAAGCPVLAAAYGTGPSCVNGPAAVGKLKLPDMRGRTIYGLHPGIAMFDTLLEAGGSRDAVVVSHGHPGSSADQPPHSHTADQPPHSHTADQAPHTHPIDGDTGDRIAFTHTSSHATVTVGGGDATAQEVSYGHLDEVDPGISVSTEDPGISVSTEDPGISLSIAPAGVSGTDANVPPYRVGNWIMRLG